MSNRRTSDRIVKRTRKPEKVTQVRVREAIAATFNRLGLLPKSAAFKK